MRREKKEKRTKQTLNDLPLFNKPAFEGLSAYVGDTSLMRELVEIFLQQAEILLDKLDATLIRADDGAYRHLLHDLLNEAQVVRADALQQLCKRAEDEAAKEFPDRAGERLAAIRQCVQDTRDVLLLWLQESDTQA